jgi:cobalt-zinc-cadmium efflux system protein
MSHPHDHAHAPVKYNRVFAASIALNVIYVVVEVAFGVLIGSLALLADAGHNLTDIIGLLLAWGAAYLSTFPPTERHTYGLRSSTILAALANALILLVAVGASSGRRSAGSGSPN